MRLSILAIMLVASQSVAGTVPAPLRDIQVTVKPSAIGDSIRYEYSVTNSSSNNAAIFGISIFLDMDPLTQMKPSEAGLSACLSRSKTSSDANFANLPIVPVGASAPTLWTCGYSVVAKSTGGYRWGKGKLKPGTTVSGFVLQSNGVPAIRTIIAEPDIDTDALPTEYEENVELTSALENSVRWVGKTVGPGAPPRVFTSQGFLQKIVEFKVQAVSLGWIKDNGIIKSIEAKLEAAKQKIEQNNPKAAKQILEALVSELKAQGGKGISNEAAVLLYGNIVYLLNHWPQAQ